MNTLIPPPGEFGKHVKRLREVRGLTQEQLAERSNLAADTVRRLEHQDFSPSLRTLRKICAGFGISLSTLFNSFELPSADPVLKELNLLLHGRSPKTLHVVMRVAQELVAQLDD